MHYYVFDTRAAHGWSFRSPYRWQARAVAIIMGRHYDYSIKATTEDDFEQWAVNV